MNSVEYNKLKTVLKSKIQALSLQDPRYSDVLVAFSIAEKAHVKTRKGGQPEFSHQLNILGFAMSLHQMLIDPHLVYITCLLHDTLEDYSHFISEIEQKLPYAVPLGMGMSKIRHGIKVPSDVYFAEIAESPILSVAKLIDRIHNLSTMSGAFSIEKQLEYINEANQYFFPMIKQAKIKNPVLYSVYELLKSVLSIQCSTISAIHAGNANIAPIESQAQS